MKNINFCNICGHTVLAMKIILTLLLYHTWNLLAVYRDRYSMVEACSSFIHELRRLAISAIQLLHGRYPVDWCITRGADWRIIRGNDVCYYVWHM